jgi:putative flippase GtrA
VHLDAVVPQRFHGITKELAKFGTIGVINLVINFGVANVLLLTVLRGGEVKAKAVAALVATTCAYFMNRHWTYRDRPKSTLRREYSLFFFFNLVGLVIETGAVAFTKYGLHQTHILAFNISTAVGIGLGTLFRFWSYRTYVFKLEPEPEPASTRLAFAASFAEFAQLPSAQPHADDTAVRSLAPRLVVTSTEDGSVVIKILGDNEELDEINMDEPARTS